MEMPTPCPACGEIVEFHDMVNHPNDFKTLVCEDCQERIEEENNSGSSVDGFGNTLSWKASPDDELICVSVNDDEVTEWSYEDDPESVFHEFMKVWNKAQQSIPNKAP